MSEREKKTWLAWDLHRQERARELIRRLADDEHLSPEAWATLTGSMI